jgi:hypothetical protein
MAVRVRRLPLARLDGCDDEPMGKRATSVATANGRLMWGGPSGARLFDRRGNAFVRGDDELSRSGVEALIGDPSVVVVVAPCGGSLRWLDGDARMRVWQDLISPNFIDVENWKPPRGAPGQRPFEATLWRGEAGIGRVLMFAD